jgi:glycosyltransferase involved in cell wall biosynthesis
LFSSNSQFYYEFLKAKPKHTKAIDLIHAFMHSHEDSSEKWSLPVIDKLNHRVIINLKTGQDLESLYKKNNVFEEYLKRIVFISNFVDSHEYKAKSFDGQIKVLYVGRGTSEKRVHLLAMIAKRVKELNLNIEFNFVGNVLAAIPHELKQYCVVHGEIKDKAELNKLYSDAHILAMASTREGFPMVIMEAMMHGTIPITSDVGGISQHVNKTNGILINEIEPSVFMDMFINEFTKLISDKNRMKKMSENAYQYAKEHFNQKQFTEGYIKLFKD